jgi:translation initiation factor IF-2
MKENFKPRQPIVVILGHVDHGKTTLLDAIRKTDVAKKEVGGITQKIGASVVTTKGDKKITFIDTPGHAAFSNMRARGAKFTDIAVLVVAANEGVKPQTKEALKYILNLDLPFIVVATKMDIAGASSDLVKTQLQREGIMFEGGGGDTPLIKLSAREGTGVDELLETIALLSELRGIKGDKSAPLEAGVIETSKEKMGPSVSLVVRNGSISVGDRLVSESRECKVKGLFDEFGKSVRSVGPGEPVKVLGFSELPPVGSRVWSEEGKPLPIKAKKEEMTRVPEEDGLLNVLIKAQSAGSLEAIISNLPEDVLVVASGVGDVTESDVFMAKSSDASIFTFESKISPAVAKLAETEGVKVQGFDVVYRLFEKIDETLKKGEVEIMGIADVIAEFPFEGKRVAGCKVKMGKINKKDKPVLMRGKEELGEVKIISIKKGKEEVEEVSQGEECGIFFAPQLDFKLSDMLISTR